MPIFALYWITAQQEVIAGVVVWEFCGMQSCSPYTPPFGLRITFPCNPWEHISPVQSTVEKLIWQLIQACNIWAVHIVIEDTEHIHTGCIILSIFLILTKLGKARSACQKCIAVVPKQNTNECMSILRC